MNSSTDPLGKARSRYQDPQLWLQSTPCYSPFAREFRPETSRCNVSVTMQDIQAQSDTRQVAVQRVGIKDLQLPIRVLQKDQQTQTAIATLALSVELSHNERGTHMSRFVEVLDEWRERAWSPLSVELLLGDVRRRLDAHSARADVRFQFFLTKEAPVTEHPSTMPYPCRFAGSSSGGELDLVTAVEVPVTTLCPCSKEISEVGAHSQRSWLKVKVRPRPQRCLWLEDLIAELETHGSCQVYPLLKRPDEKYVTEQAYHNPKFVEDVLRDAVVALRQSPDIAWFEAECEAAESIHLHNVFAFQRETVVQQKAEPVIQAAGATNPENAHVMVAP